MNRQDTNEYKVIAKSIDSLAWHYIPDFIEKESLQEAIDSDKISINEITIIFKQKLEELLK